MQRIAIDIDGVLADLMPVWLSRYNRDCSDTLTPAHITEWDIAKFTKGHEDVILSYLASDDLYDDVRPIAGSQDAVKALKKSFDVIYITSCVLGGMIEAKIRWMQRFGFLKEDRRSFDKRLVVASNKDLVSFDYLIDDRAATLVKLSRPKRGILFAQPWNDIDVLPEHTMRVDGWDNVVKTLGAK